MIPYRYIVIEGNIGAGKTSLVQKLAPDIHARIVLEEFADNPFLPKFYDQPERYAFPLELGFLAERFSQLTREISQPELFGQPVVSDYFINKCQIFAKNNLDGDEYELFLRLFSMVQAQIPKPDLLVYLYLDVENLQRNIRRRGREYEKKITDEYLDNIQQQYLEFIRQHEHMRVLVLDTNNLDFVNKNSDYLNMKKNILAEYPVGVHRI
ncbi:MAG: deoxynucleoside kinase [Flavobacteriales bacterium]|nr:deoxynucleoside kinase [Flavobacteriales bacterium]